MKKQDIIVLSSIILVLIAMRSIFNIPNFNPIGAIALMGGILFHKKTTAFLVTIGALFLGDIILGLSSPIYMDYMFSTTFLFVYVAFFRFCILYQKYIGPLALFFLVIFTFFLQEQKVL